MTVTIKTEILAGYLSRVQITERFKISESSLTQYQKNYPDFPSCIKQHVISVNRAIATFRTVEIVAWFEEKDAMLKASKLRKKGVDLELVRQFLTLMTPIYQAKPKGKHP